MRINWSPTPPEEVVQNVRTLLATAPGTVPLARAMGTPQDIVDQPQSIAAAQLHADVVKAVRTYEPRVDVEVSITGTSEGKLTATVEIVKP